MFTADFFATGYADARSFHQLGITRVGDITGLDTIGLPVWFACRPNSRALSLSQGKGMTHAQARISAVMESAECAIAERPEDIVSLFAPLRDMRQSGRQTIPFERMLRCTRDSLDDQRELAWVRGFSQKTGAEIFAPYELIGLDMRARTTWDHEAFKMSSIGLAAGSSEDAATSHALLELAEHDATANLDLLGLNMRSVRSVRHIAGAHGALDEAVAAVAAAGLTPYFFDITGDINLPVIACFMNRAVMSGDGTGAKLIAGFACRPDAYEAALAALLECVQSRATDIAGSRDDIISSDYDNSRMRLPDGPRPSRVLSQVKGHRTQVERHSTQVMDSVLGSGIEDIYVFPLTKPDMGFSVVRVLVPGLNVAGTAGVTRAGAGLIDALLAGI